MIEYLVRMLQPQYRIAIVSRGYKRKTKGYVRANQNTTALEIGDEPMQFRRKFPDVEVVVCEERVEAIPMLLQDAPQTEVILLDDAFQHRAIRPGFSIVLTEAANLFTRDYFLPAGDLRDERASIKRADLIVVTKCDPGLTPQQQQRMVAEIAPAPHQQVFFTTIQYNSPYHLFHNSNTLALNHLHDVLLVAGIANVKPLKNYLQEQVHTYDMLSYTDHHIFTLDDLSEIKSRFEQLPEQNRMILTTEKDAVRLLKFKNELEQLPVYVLPVAHRFLFEGAPVFEQAIRTFLRTFQQKH